MKRRRRNPILHWCACAAFAFLLATWLPVLALRWMDPPLTAFMVFESRASGNATRYEWIDRAGLGSEAALAVIAAEDQRFADHHGLDFDAILDAIKEYKGGQPMRGGSGITQQLAKNLFLWSGRSLLRKGLEAWLAVLMEITLSKRRILEVYLNVVEVGPGIYGVPAGARVFFGKEPSVLTPHEAALLAAVLPNPARLRANGPSAYLRERQSWIEAQARRLRREGWLKKIDW